MSSDDSQRPGVVGVATGGIQDVSALLPLLGTEQCERLVTSTLQKGLLYTAATPMSIFGSLGIVKAGLIVLLGSIDNRFFSGPTFLRNAGFTPSEVGELLTPVASDNRRLYIAEDRIDRHLSNIRILSIEVNLLSKDLQLWNLRLVGTTIILSSLGLLPYIYLIVRFLPNDPFRTTWMYPVVRIIGCDLVALSIQFIFQVRILEEICCRIRYTATDSYLKGLGKSIPAFWDPNERSKNTLQHAGYHLIEPEDRRVILRDLSGITRFSFRVVKQDNSVNTPGDPENGRPHGAADGLFGVDSRPPRRFLPLLHISSLSLLLWTAQASLIFGLGLSVVGYVGCFSVVQASPRGNARGPLVWLICEASLAILRMVIWASNPSWDGPPSPIVLEKVSPPIPANTKVVSEQQNSFDDRPQIALGEGSRSVEGKANPLEKRASFGVGWMLDSFTANDMHALVVGAGMAGNDHPDAASTDHSYFTGAVDRTQAADNVEKVAAYLQDTLLVPRTQITRLTNSEATRARIVEELKALAERESVAGGVPIVIYFSMPSGSIDKVGYDSFGANTRTYSGHVIPWLESPRGDELDLDQLKRCRLSYDDISKLLGNIAAKKTDNITFILDSGSSGASEIGLSPESNSWLVKEHNPSEHRPDIPPPRSPDNGTNTVFRDNQLGRSSHILLVGSGAGGQFTNALLEVLRRTDRLGALQKMTYKNLANTISAEMLCDSPPGAFYAPVMYENRLLFNGLFSRKVNESGSSPVITIQYTDL